jgi:hypothetical protein
MLRAFGIVVCLLVFEVEDKLHRHPKKFAGLCDNVWFCEKIPSMAATTAEHIEKKRLIAGTRPVGKGDY